MLFFHEWWLPINHVENKSSGASTNLGAEESGNACCQGTEITQVGPWSQDCRRRHGRRGTTEEWAVGMPWVCTGTLPAAITNEQMGFSHLKLTYRLISAALATSQPDAIGQGEERHLPKGLLPHALLLFMHYHCRLRLYDCPGIKQEVLSTVNSAGTAKENRQGFRPTTHASGWESFVCFFQIY